MTPSYYNRWYCFECSAELEDKVEYWKQGYAVCSQACASKTGDEETD